MIEVGDKVQMPGVPFVLAVLELGECDEADCPAPAVFRFVDPEGNEDWLHASDVVRVDA